MSDIPQTMKPTSSAIASVRSFFKNPFQPAPVSSPATRAGLNARPEAERRMLYISGFSPNPNSSSSGQKLAFAKLEEFARRFARIDIIYFTNELEELDAGQAAPLWPANVRDKVQFHLTRKMRMAAALLMPHLPMFVAVRRLAARSELARRLADPAYTDFYADFSQGLAALPSAQMPLFTFRQHDIVSKLYGRQAENSTAPKSLFYLMEKAKARAWERAAWSRVAGMETLSEDDAILIRHAHPATPVRYAPPTTTVAVDPEARTESTVVRGRMIFFGNMSRQENIDAVVWMAREMLPDIRLRHPEAHLWIVGAHPSPEVLSLAGPDIHVTGFVDDPMGIFAQAHLAVVPLRLGSGVKIKVLETLAAGIPTITTPVGAEGIPAHPLLNVVENAREFTDRVCEFMAKPGVS